MTVFAIMAGSLIGFMGGLVGWAAFDLSIWAALGLYLGTGLAFGVAAVLCTVIRLQPAPVRVEA